MDDDLLGPLRDGPLPPLAPAAALRARGEQRRRRRRLAVAGAAAAVLVLAGVTGVAVGGSRDADELQPVPFAGPSPESAPPDPLWAALLDPEDVEQVLGGDWDDLRGGESSFSGQLEGCPETAPATFPSSARFLTDGRVVLGQDITLHADAAAADARFQELLAMLRACGESSPAYRLFDSGGQATTRVFGEVLTAGEPVRPFSVERVGRAVVTLVLEGPSEPSPDLTEAAAAEVRAELGVPVEEPGRAEWALPDAFLPPEEAARAEFDGWSVTEPFEPDDVTPAANPCGEGRIPLDDAVRDQGERAMGSTREVGGSSLLQEVYRYATATTAAQALAEYEQQFARCSDVQDPNADQGWTIRSAVVDRQVSDDGVRTLVRRIPCSPEGACTEHFATYAMLVREADAVTVVLYMIGEDGDPAEQARALITAVQKRLREVVGA